MTTPTQAVGQNHLPVPHPAALVLALAAALRLLLHILAINHYGYFRDELYYIASTHHLDFGYVDHPPFSIYLLAAFTAVFGDSLAAVRSLAALLGVGTVAMAGLMARELGGGRFAQGAAALAVALSPVLLGSGNFYSMNVVEHCIWATAGFVFLMALRTQEQKFWILFGLILGIGLLNKVSALWLGAGITAALLLTPHRRWLRTPWPWVAGAIAFVVFLPFLVWQVVNGFPTLEFIRNATSLKMIAVSPADYIANQFLPIGPFALPVVIAALVGPFVLKALRYSLVSLVVFLTVALILSLSGTAKAYYLGTAYPFLFAPGACAIERVMDGKGWRAGIRFAVIALLLGGIAIVPFAVPLLPPETFIAYQQWTGVSAPAEERGRLGPLPQHFADQFGWNELAENVAKIYYSLPPSERAQASIYAQNYGEAGAIDVLGRRLGLPRAISGHNSYWFWGPGEYNGQVLIIIGGRLEDHIDDFESVVEAGVSDHPYAMPYERNLRIFVGRKLKGSPADVWKQTKRFI